MGYEAFGNVYIFKIGDRCWVRNDAGCRRYDFRLEAVTARRANPAQSFSAAA
jgi:hypothetical protein